jgi:extradiol dioxygenase family protein
MNPFHLAFAIDDIEDARRFYHGVLGCPVGREASNWIDFDFFGNQISAHVHRGTRPDGVSYVGREEVPLHHFGVLLPWAEWEALAERITGAPWPFVIAPHTRFEGEPGEQGTFFLKDPSNNALEFKAFRHPEDVYAPQTPSDAETR